jgi:hypothetical protein
MFDAVFDRAEPGREVHRGPVLTGEMSSAAPGIPLRKPFETSPGTGAVGAVRALGRDAGRCDREAG